VIAQRYVSPGTPGASMGNDVISARGTQGNFLVHTRVTSRQSREDLLTGRKLRSVPPSYEEDLTKDNL
jgi:hypothetical protein